MANPHRPRTTAAARRLLTVLGTVLALAALGAGPALAQARALACGAVLTEDTTLAADLACPEGEVALVIGADGITVDLGGFAVGGPVNLTPRGSVGIDNPGNHDGVTIRNGTVQNFEVGVRLAQGDRNRVTGVVLLFNTAGVAVDGGSGNRVDGNQVRQSDLYGVDIRGLAAPAAGNVVAGNSFDFNFFRPVSVAGGTVTGTVVEGNSFNTNDGIPIGGETDGVVVISSGPDDVRGTRVRDNTFNLNTDAVVVGENAAGTLVEGNRLDRVLGDGVSVLGRDTTIRLNQIAGAYIGIRVEDEADGVRITGNRLLDNGPAVDSSGTAVAVQLNHIEEAAEGSRVERNLALDNRTDGILVENPATTVTANTANDNGELGIDAVPGVVDGGGNRARGNGDPRQCVGVTCR